MTERSNTELAATKTPGGISVIPVAPAEYSDMHPGDILPPFINVVQPTSEFGKKGYFRRSDTGEEYEVLNVVSLRVQKNRTYWGPGKFSRSRVPLCYSTDGNFGAEVNGAGDPTTHPKQDCMTCPDRTDTPWKDGHKTMCSGGYMVYLFNVETFETYGLRLTGKGSSQLARKFDAKSILQRTIMTLWTEESTNDSGTWYAIKDEVSRVVSPSEWEVLVAEAKTISKTAASPVGVSSNTNATLVDNSPEDDPGMEKEKEKAFEQMNPAGAAARVIEEEPEQAAMGLEDHELLVGDGDDEPSFDPTKPPW